MRVALILLVMLLPAVLYVGYLMIRRSHGEEGDGTERWWRRAGFALIAGEVLATILLAWWLLGAGARKELIYIPPHFEDGQMVPGRFVEPPAR